MLCYVIIFQFIYEFMQIRYCCRSCDDGVKSSFFMSKRNHFVTYTGAQHFYLYALCVYVYS